MSFDSEFDAALRKSVNYLRTMRNQSVLELGSKIIDDTPFLTGALKGSWRSSPVVPNMTLEPRLTDEAGTVPKAELAQAVENWPDEGSLWMTNSLRYSEGVEFDGWSTQRPGGMVRVNIAGRTDFADLHTGTGRTE